MATLPTPNSLTGDTVTEGQFKEKLTEFINYTAELPTESDVETAKQGAMAHADELKEETDTNIQNIISTTQSLGTAITNEVSRATAKETSLETLINDNKQSIDTALSNLQTTANIFYPTLAAANADIANIMPKTSTDTTRWAVSIGEVANGGIWYKDTYSSTNLSKSPYDPVIIASTDATTKATTAQNNAVEIAAENTAVKTKAAEDNAKELVKVLNGGSLPYQNQNSIISSANIQGFISKSGVLSGTGSPNWNSSDYIDVSDISVISINLVTQSIVGAVSFYDAAKIFISCSTTTSTTAVTYISAITIPTNAKYMRFTKATSSLISSAVTAAQITAQDMVYDTWAGVYSTIRFAEIDAKISNLGDQIESGEINITAEIWSMATLAGYYDTTGNIKDMASGNWIRTPLLALEDYLGGSDGTLSIKCLGHTAVSSVIFYDASQRIISHYESTSTSLAYSATVTIPANAVYVTVCGGSPKQTSIASYASLSATMSVKDEILEIKTSLPVKNSYDLLAPVAVYTTCNDIGSAKSKGRNRNYSAALYLDHFLNGLTEEKHIRFKDGVDKVIFTAPMVVTNTDEVSPTVTLNNGVKANESVTPVVVHGDDIVTTTLNIKHRSALNSATSSAFPKVLCIGDSITYGEMATLPDDGFSQNHAYHLIAKELFMKDAVDNSSVGFNCLFLGTRSRSKTTTYNNTTLTVTTKHEGVRGRTIAQHLDGSDTTFWDSASNKWSINAYLAKYRTMDDTGTRLTLGNGTGTLITSSNLTTIDVCTPTHVLIALGMNSGGTLAQFQTMIDSIRSELPNTIIGIAIPDAAGTYFPSLHPNCSNECTIWNDTGSQGSRKNQQYNLLKTLQDYYGVSYESQNIYLVPFYHSAPTAESVSFRKVDQLDKDYSSILSSEYRQHYGWNASTHTNALGHINWGYQLYSWLKWTIAKTVT